MFVGNWPLFILNWIRFNSHPFISFFFFLCDTFHVPNFQLMTIIIFNKCMCSLLGNEGVLLMLCEYPYLNIKTNSSRFEYQKIDLIRSKY